MIKFFGILFSIFFISQYLQAHTFNAEKELVSLEWSGGSKFVKNLQNSGLNPCDFLKQKMQDKKVDMQRIVLIGKETQCPEKVALVKMNLRAADPMLVANTIDLADSLPTNERNKYVSIFKEMNRQKQDFAVKRALDNFFSKK